METLIRRIAKALSLGMTEEEIALHFAKEGSPEEVWLAFQAALILLKEPEVS